MEILKHFSLNQNITTNKSIPTDADSKILSLRPAKLYDYVGQTNTVKSLKIAINAAKKRKEALEHIIFHGPPGLGKTTLAYIIANEMNSNITITSGPALEKGGDLLGILTHIKEGDILFIDEIHRTPKIVEELLYPAMEDFAVDFIFDKGIHAKSHRFRLNRFSLIGATTRVGLLSAPLRDRFGIFRTLDFYTDQELIKIIFRTANLLNIKITPDGAEELAKRSRGTPRIVNRLIKRVRDYAQVKKQNKIEADTVTKALNMEGIDNKGLTNLDINYLNTILKFYNGGPVGIEAIAATLQEEADTLVDVVEPYLLKLGFIIRTSSGRKALPEAYKHFGIALKNEKELKQKNIF
ncbi:MAG: Holliday junction branch migration DNA helicase RuvB [Deltaproteobacteria bacterium]|nr:Holliday junction branch migration DNA helicase RuvB [Deltaproteobacteria bacterium]